MERGHEPDRVLVREPRGWGLTHSHTGSFLQVFTECLCNGPFGSVQDVEENKQHRLQFETCCPLQF